MISKWVLDHTDAAKMIQNGDKTYIVITDYDRVRVMFGKLLKEIQRIKSQGDYDAAQKLVERYGVKIDYDLHREVLERMKKYNVSPYTAVINPNLKMDDNENVTIEYPMDFTEQMLDYSERYGFLSFNE